MTKIEANTAINEAVFHFNVFLIEKLLMDQNHLRSMFTMRLMAEV